MKFKSIFSFATLKTGDPQKRDEIVLLNKERNALLCIKHKMGKNVYNKYINFQNLHTYKYILHTGWHISNVMIE